MEEKSQIEIAYYNEFNRDFNEDMRNTFTTQEGVKFISFFRLSEDISHLDDSLIIDIILSIADAKRDIRQLELSFSTIKNK